MVDMKTLATKTDPKNVARRAKAAAKRSAEVDAIIAENKDIKARTKELLATLEDEAYRARRA